MAPTDQASIFDFTRTSIGCINIFLWISGVLTMAALTIKDFLPLLDEYRSNNMATQVSFDRDSSFTPPQIVQCIPFYLNDDSLMTIVRHLINKTECSICPELEKEGFAVWKETNLSRFENDSLESFYVALSFQLAKKLLSKIGENEENVFDQKFSSWNTPLRIATMNFFNYWSDKDVWFGLRQFEGPMKNDLNEMLDNVDTTKLDLLFGPASQAFCQNMIFKDFSRFDDYSILELTNTSCQDLLLDQNLPASIDLATGLWFSFPRLDLPKTKTYHFTLLESDIISWVRRPSALRIENGTDQVPNPFIIYADKSALYSSSFDTVPMPYIYQAVRPGYGLNITMRYSVQVRARDNRRRHSCKNESSDTCLTKCIKDMIIQKCRCAPYFFKRGLSFDPGLPYCTYAIYNACNLTTPVTTDFNDRCSTVCRQQSCEFMSYNWQISHEFYGLLEDSRNKSEFNLILVPMITSFTEFTWTVKNTPEQFLSQMGGIVNFYLGFSGLSLVHFIVLSVGFLRQRLFRQRKSEKPIKMSWRNGRDRSGQKEQTGDRYWSRQEDRSKFEVKSDTEISLLKNQIAELQSEMRRMKILMEQKRF